MRTMSHYGQQRRKKRKEEHKFIGIINLFLFVLAALFVLATLCVTADGMRASAHPDLFTRPSTRTPQGSIGRASVIGATLPLRRALRHMLTYFESL